jgi:hypothetical protein
VDTTVGQGDESRARGAPPRTWALTIAHHPEPAHLGRTLLLEPDQALALGRGAACFGPGVLDDALLSRRHAELRLAGGTLRARDEGSRNHTFVNGAAIDEVELRAGDVLGVGGVLLVVHRCPPGFQPRPHPRLVGVGHALQRCLDELARVASHATTVLLEGETGTGKDLAARELHLLSGRPGPFVTLACGSLGDDHLHGDLFGYAPGSSSGLADGRAGLLEAADGGTLFLDGIADASPALQTSLLRFLEQGEVRRVGASATVRVDVRVVAARSPGHRRLRDDFGARLSRFVVRLPPLRDRTEDVPLLAAHLARRFTGTDTPLHRHLVLALLRHPWPRNVHELDSVVQRAIIDAGDARPVPLSPAVQELLGAEPDAGAPLPPDALAVAASGRWFRVPGDDRVSLRRRDNLALVLRALARARDARPGQPLSVEELFRAGWPEDRAFTKSAAGRVYVALTALRNLGLRALIVREESGYCLDPETRLQLVEHE